ncbi:PREDICTED: leucine-rich repeat-containing protein 4-like [Branchiostoma belcheri]|uniref:Leucine-rich repeat-containing protein 4-like n=1 Tax=Branchiostoma belcheri TaxID=7741 RepID=A0A6P4YLC3_BRABE|nr:PREDICTED: leucine-rich repeat-containing protein 4-like [Branchiostoma belcheri]
MRMYILSRLHTTAVLVQEVCYLLLSVFVLVETDESECPPPCSCADQYSELVVSCGGRNLARIPAHLPSTTTWLDLKYNNITKVTSKSFKDTTQVKGINLSHNRIHKISVNAFKKLKHLDTIDLSQNLLKTISYDLFKVPIESAVRDARRFFATLAINPWLCDCRLAWLADMFRNGSHMFSSRLVTCDAPKRLKGLDVEDVPREKLCPIATIAPDGVRDNSTLPMSQDQYNSTLPMLQHQYNSTLPMLQHQHNSTLPMSQHQHNSTLPMSQHQHNSTLPMSQSQATGRNLIPMFVSVPIIVLLVVTVTGAYGRWGKRHRYEPVPMSSIANS